ncbi:MAG TPA: hydantoinase/oxoprolinase family protein [Thermoleophilaceae bacterium]|nr:hydantoinase/oxoprolinase family protein [Thermoleophilaceae bacterium]
MGIRVGIDTGGTFTDLIAVDSDTGEWYLAKVPSNPREPVAAIAAAVEQAQFDPANVEFIVVGTTIGINAVLTRTGARVRFLTTEGFADIPHIQRINRKNHYDYRWRKPQPLAARQDCMGLRERVDEEGAVVVALDPAEVQDAVADLDADADGPAAVAVCFLFSYANPANERAARDAIESVAPELAVSLSHEVAPIWREYERGLAAMLDAYLKPALDGYVAGVSEAFASQGVEARWSLLKSNGGHAVADEASDRPAHVLLSGIAGGAIGGAYFARRRDAERAIVVDMGGTSCDVCLIVDGEPLYSSEFEIEFGLPVSVPTVNTKTIGAGGGSIGWVDPGGFLQVGPQSAGADPGPACYDNGGSEATVTDADLALGRLDPDFFLGGKLELNPRSSGAALRRIGDRLGLDEVDVASSMVRIANENMANAIRIVTVEQGIDPRNFAIVAMGGAGPTHAAEIADAIGIERVIVPPNPGLSSAFGALAADVRVDEVRSVSLKSTTTTGAELTALFADFEQVALGNFEAQSPGGERAQIQRTISMRYEGQNYEQEVTAPEGELGEPELAAIVERYHDLHDEFYGYRFEGVPIEMVRLAVTVTGAGTTLPEPRLDAQRVGDAVVADDRVVDVHFDDGGFQPTPIVDRRRLGAGAREGPMIVQSMDTTLVVPPGWRLESDAAGVIELIRDTGERPAPNDAR